MEQSLMFVTAITPIHNGAGEGLGLIDRPIIRERITNFPYIQASSIKGTMRDEFEFKKQMAKAKVESLFGPMDDGSKHSGCISFTDANILAFPVRSLKGCFVWATSPHNLYRFWRTVQLAKLDDKFTELRSLTSNPNIHSDINDVLISQNDKNKDKVKEMLLVKDKIILEEFQKSVKPLVEVGKFAKELADIIFTNSFINNEFINRFVILPENTFRYFVTYATEVVPNIKIDDITGTSKEGLRYTEYLPSETILYSLIGFDKTKSGDAELDNATKVKNVFINNKPERIQLGADETKGKGFVELTFLS